MRKQNISVVFMVNRRDIYRIRHETARQRLIYLIQFTRLAEWWRLQKYIKINSLRDIPSPSYGRIRNGIGIVVI